MSYGPPPPDQQPYAAPLGPPRRSPLAVWALVSGIVGTLLALVGSLIGVALGIAAIVLGFLARRAVAASGGQLTGDRMALIGLILGVVPVLLLIVSIVLLATGVVDAPSTRG